MNEILSEGWSQKYKKSINCSHPKGFSQKAHCAGKSKHNESIDMEMVCEDCGMCQTHGNLTEIAKGAKGVAEVAGAQKCWPGFRKTGTQPGTGKNAGKRVNDCEKIKEDDVEESGLQYYTGVKKHGKEYMTKAAQLARDGASQEELGALKDRLSKAHKGKAKNESMAEGLDELSRIMDLSGLMLTADEQFDIIEEMVGSWAEYHGVDAEVIWEDVESVDDHELLDESAAWKRSAGKSKKGGLNAKGVASYRRENPGSKLQMAVTTKPSKLKPGSKAAKRRKSFCARMGGNKGPMKKPNGDPTRKALALRKWNC
jgi:hypothetical protein